MMQMALVMLGVGGMLGRVLGKVFAGVFLLSGLRRSGKGEGERHDSEKQKQFFHSDCGLGDRKRKAVLSY